MKPQRKNIPSLRFPEFRSSLESKELGSVTKWSSGGTPPTNITSYWNGDIPWISASSMRGTDYLDSDLKLTNEGVLNGSKIAPEGSVLILVRGSMLFRSIPVGRAAKDVAFNQDVKAIQCNAEVLPNFLLYWLLAAEPKLRSLVTGTGIGAGKLDLADLQSMTIVLPDLVEQQKIASFLAAIDKKIEQLGRKRELLLKYKKGVMQQIFDQKIRFKDNHGNIFPDWKEMQGKEVFRSHSNKDHDGTLPILAASQERGMVYRDGIGIRIQSTDESISSYKVVEPGDFVISLRSFQGGLEYSQFKGICSPAYTILKPRFKINDDFFRFYFKKEDFIERLSKTVVGIRDGKQISYEAFGGLKLRIPSIAEQAKIADFLTAIDQKIELVSQQLEKNKTFKKGLLQQMFV